MGYYTTLRGRFDVTPPFSDLMLARLQAIRKERHDAKDSPSNYCYWEPTEDGQGIECRESDCSFYNYVEWLEWIVTDVLAPEGYTVNGAVEWEGSEHGDLGCITVTNNVVSEQCGRIVYEDENDQDATTLEKGPSGLLAYVCRLPDYVRTGNDDEDYVTVVASNEDTARRSAAADRNANAHMEVEDPGDIAIVAAVPVGCSTPATDEPKQIICWTEGAVVHDVDGVPPGYVVIFRDLDTESMDEDRVIEHDEAMGYFVTLGPYFSKT
jgi:hypothetical protein